MGWQIWSISLGYFIKHKLFIYVVCIHFWLLFTCTGLNCSHAWTRKKVRWTRSRSLSMASCLWRIESQIEGQTLWPQVILLGAWQGHSWLWWRFNWHNGWRQSHCSSLEKQRGKFDTLSRSLAVYLVVRVSEILNDFLELSL